MFKLSISFSQIIFPKVFKPNSSSQLGIDCKKALFDDFGMNERSIFSLSKAENFSQFGNSILFVIRHNPNRSHKKFFELISSLPISVNFLFQRTISIMILNTNFLSLAPHFLFFFKSLFNADLKAILSIKIFSRPSIIPTAIFLWSSHLKKNKRFNFLKYFFGY